MGPSRVSHRRRWEAAAAILAVGLGVALIIVPGQRHTPKTHRDDGIARGIAFLREEERGGEGDRLTGPASFYYLQRAYPQEFVKFAQIRGAIAANDALSSGGQASQLAQTFSLGAWHEEGPIDPFVPSSSTQNQGADTNNSGRETALVIGPTCVPGDCRVWVGAAGGGVWRTDDALAAQPAWTPIDTGLDTNAIGSLAIDPTDPSGNTIYVGTGEASASGDSEAGLGLYRSTDAGDHWSIVAGSVPVSRGNAIGSIAIDPTDESHIFIATSVAFAGISPTTNPDVPPGPAWGLYESTDGGATFSLVFGPSDSLGVTQVGLDPNDPSTVYATAFGYGLWRRSPSVDGNSDFHQVFATFDPTDPLARSAFALAEVPGAGDVGSHTTRIYLGDSTTITGAYSALFRVDDANVPASELTDGTNNPGWTSLSSSTNGDPGFGSFNFCQGQCFYDMFVATPPGHPDEVWLGGAMAYDELAAYGGVLRSNGRAVIRSTDAGVTWDDMTGDARDPSMGMHPDQHAIAFAPNSDVVFVGSDGGLVRVPGTYSDTSADCAGRSLSGADLTDCVDWLSGVPTQIDPINNGLATIQFSSVSVNPTDSGDLMGGTQDNGTWSNTPNWFESVGGDGGLSGYDAANPDIRFHTYFEASPDVNFHGADPAGWDWIGDPLFEVEPQAFYIPITADPVNPGYMFAGLSHVWRTTDNGGPQAYLDQHCNEVTGDFTVQCGDWKPLGSGARSDLTSPAWGSRDGLWLSAVVRASHDKRTLWAATGAGRVFLITNVNRDPSQTRFFRIDLPSTPERWISEIAVDPNNQNHAFISYSGFDAYTPSTPGHVFEVFVNSVTHHAVWRNLSKNIGDQPITGIAFDGASRTLFVATDFGVLRFDHGQWVPAGTGLPTAAANSLTLVDGKVLYAATHGRGIWSLQLGES